MADYRRWHWYYVHQGGVPDPIPRAIARVGGLVASLGGASDRYKLEYVHPAMSLDEHSAGKRYEDRDGDEQDSFVKGLLTTMTVVGKQNAE